MKTTKRTSSRSKELRAIACAAIAIALGAPLSAEDAIDQHIAAVGGLEAIAEVKSLERTARAALATPQGEFDCRHREIYDLTGDRGATSLGTRSFLVETGWVGQEGWRDHSNEGFSTMDTAALALAKMRSHPSIIASVVEQYGRAAIQPLETCTYQDEPCHVVRFAATPTEVLVSQASHLILAIVIPNVMTYHFSDYEKVEGVSLPNRVILQIPAQRMTITYDYRKTTLNGKLKDGWFKRGR